MIEANDQNVGTPDQTSRLNAAMTRKNRVVFINDYGIDEAVYGNAVADLSELLFRMRSCVFGIGKQLFDFQLLDARESFTAGDRRRSDPRMLGYPRFAFIRRCGSCGRRIEISRARTSSARKLGLQSFRH